MAAHSASATASAADAAQAAARRSYGKLVAFLAARTRDVAGAEDALAGAFAGALEIWPVRGVPDNPEAWLLTAAPGNRGDGSEVLGDFARTGAGADRRKPAGKLRARGGAPNDRRIAQTKDSGALAGLDLLDTLSTDGRLAQYQPCWAARAGLLADLGAAALADAAYERACGLERDEAVRRFLQGKRAAIQSGDRR